LQIIALIRIESAEKFSAEFRTLGLGRHRLDNGRKRKTNKIIA
jgi:hypothetical protein